MSQNLKKLGRKKGSSGGDEGRQLWAKGRVSRKCPGGGTCLPFHVPGRARNVTRLDCSEKGRIVESRSERTWGQHAFTRVQARVKSSIVRRDLDISIS